MDLWGVRLNRQRVKGRLSWRENLYMMWLHDLVSQWSQHILFGWLSWFDLKRFRDLVVSDSSTTKVSCDWVFASHLVLSILSISPSHSLSFFSHHLHHYYSCHDILYDPFALFSLSLSCPMFNVCIANWIDSSFV